MMFSRLKKRAERSVVRTRARVARQVASEAQTTLTSMSSVSRARVSRVVSPASRAGESSARVSRSRRALVSRARCVRAASIAPAAPATPVNKTKERYAPLPTVPSERVHWIDDAGGLKRATAAVRALDAAARDASTSGRQPPCVGLDGEWRPGDNSPVALLQIATREEVFLIDLLATAPRGAGQELNDATDELLRAVLWSEHLYKLGFSFGYDIKRMKASYSHLKVWGEKSKNLIDVKQLAFAASPNKMPLRCGLAVLTRQVIGCLLDKKQQCSDWGKRPLTEDQIAYAAADGYSLCLIFDKCLTMIDDEEEIPALLQKVVELGEPLRGLPRKVKKVRVKAQRAAKKAAKKGGQGKPCQFARETPIEKATADVVNSLESVGATLSSGRKGAVDLLAADVPIRTKNDGRNVDRWANAISVFISVGKPQTKGPTSFWEKDGELYMKWDGKASGALDDDVACLRRSTSAESEGVSGESALLFMRRPPGQFVFCGRLECVGALQSNDSAVLVRFVDGARMRASDSFHQLIGCRLSDEPEGATYAGASGA